MSKTQEYARRCHNAELAKTIKSAEPEFQRAKKWAILKLEQLERELTAN